MWRRSTQRFIEFTRTAQCEKFLQYAIEYATHWAKLHVPKALKRQAVPTVGTSAMIQAPVPKEEAHATVLYRTRSAVERELEKRDRHAKKRDFAAVAQLLYNQYVMLVYTQSSAKQQLQSEHKAEAAFFEAIFKLVAGVLELLFKTAMPETQMNELHRDFNRMFRSPSFNTTVTWQSARPKNTSQVKQHRVKWRELPSRRQQARSLNNILPQIHRRVGIERAKMERSPLLSRVNPSDKDRVKTLVSQVAPARRPGVQMLPQTIYCRLPGMVNRNQTGRETV